MKKKIHIMQVIFTLDFGGAERLAASISKNLSEDGFETSVCGLFGKEGPLAEAVKKEGIPIFYLNAGEKGKMKLWREIYKLLKEQSVSILQVHGIYVLMHVLLPARWAGVKIVYTEHAKYSISKYKKMRFAAKVMSYLVEKVICVSKNLKDFFVAELKVPQDKIEVIYNGVDVEKFKGKKQELGKGVGTDKKSVIGNVARLSDPKDHFTLLTAFSHVLHVLDENHETILVVVGDGELRQEIEQRISILGLSDNVILLGKRDDIPELLAGFDIFVLSSKREGFPISILEAMACGKPVIATNVGGVSEILTDGVNGLVVPSENPDRLAGAILQLLKDKNLSERIAKNALETVKQYFSKEIMMMKYRNLFATLG
ncbi:MAG: glycosyltransferase [Thermodesulfobacteriota bacterium]|nr:glycosyltransferase [Thermodesulfobacteriota bacterium]